MHLTAERVIAGGHAIAHDADGQVVFIDNALPGELVSVAIVDRKRGFLRGVVDEVLTASPDRVAPPCAALAEGCGGCSWQHVRPEAQGRLKAAIVEDALRRIAHVDDHPDIAVHATDARAYRTTVRLAIDGDGRPGYRRRRTHDVVAPGACLVVHPALEELVTHARFPGAKEVTLRVSAATGERVALVRGDPATAHVPDDVRVAAVRARDPLAITETIGDVDLRVSARSFFQPGPAAASLLAGVVGDLTVERLADLYGGVGLFAATSGRRAGHVTLVERSRSSIADARHNLASRDARAVRAEVERWRPRPGRCFDAVVADPARTGLGREGVATIEAIAGPSTQVVVVSCDPASMARDAGLLLASGRRRLARLAIADTFPHTSQIEVVAHYEPC